MDNAFKFKIKIYSIFLQVVYDYGYISLKGYKDELNPLASLVYDASYEDFSLPEQIHQIYQTAEKLYFSLFDIKTQLQIIKNCLAFRPKISQENIQCKQKKQYIYLPLQLNQHQQDALQLQSLCDISMKPVEAQNIYNIPYKSVVRIVSKHKWEGRIYGSGVLIGNKKVLTVAHNILNRAKKSEAQEVQVFVQTKAGQKQIKVKKYCIPQEYYQTNIRDMNNYDFAYIYLEDNDIVEEDQCLQLYKEKLLNLTKFQVIGFSPILDQAFKIHNACYYLKRQKLIQVYQNHATADYKTVPGVSGGPAVYYDQKCKKWKIIGLHQGFLANFSQIIILSKYGRCPLDIINQLQEFQESLNLRSSQTGVPKKSSKRRKKLLQLYRQQALQIYQDGVKKLDENKLQQALQSLKQCLQIQAEYPGKQTKQFSNTLEMIELIERKQKLLQEHTKYQKQWLEISGSLISIQQKIQQNQNHYQSTNLSKDLTNNNKNQEANEIITQIIEQEQENQEKKLMKEGMEMDRRGQNSFNQMKYQEALQLYIKALLLFEKAYGKYTSSYAATLNNIGSIYQIKRNFKLAKENYQKAIRILNKINVSKQHKYYKTILKNKENLQKNM